MRRKIGYSTIAVMLLLALAGCSSQPTLAPTPTTSASVTVPPVINNVKYAFNNGNATSNAPASVQVEVSGKWRVISSADTTVKVAGCTVLFYAVGLPSKAKVTIANQQQQSDTVLTGFLTPAGLKATIGTTTLSTNETANGAAQKVEVAAAHPTAQAGYDVQLFARAFTNQSAFIYVQRCPAHAILNTQTQLRINTA